MRQKTFLVLLIWLTGFAAPAWGEEQSVWVGTQFRPQQCLQLAAGSFDVKRKLCTITYEIRSKEDRFEVNGRLRFNKSFIPGNVSDVELEVLLIDENRVCTKQLNMKSDVAAGEATFSFTSEKLPTQRYVRTYFVIHYEKS